MLKRTLFFESPGMLSLADRQLCFSRRSDESEPERKTIPLEDIGMIVVENRQITFTVALMQALVANNAVVVFCDEKHLPAAYCLAAAGNATTNRTVRAQLSATDASKNRLWQQTVSAKIRNQARVLGHCGRDGGRHLERLADRVKSGDPDNIEGAAARFYFSAIAFPPGFTRSPEGEMPNAALNYGYAVIRAAMARALVGSGLLCIMGIHHHNQYDSLCLADDIMEPYRPFVDAEVFGSPELLTEKEITRDMKRRLLAVLAADVMICGMKRPLQNAMSYTSASLARCFLKEAAEIDYPEFPAWQTDSPHSVPIR